MLTILWDNDGILVDTEGFYYEANRTVLREVNVDLTEELYRDYSLKRGQSTLDLALDRGIDAESVRKMRSKRNQIYADLLRSGLLVIDGVQETLSVLHGRVGMGVVTGSRWDHFDVIHSGTGIRKYFDFVVALEDSERTKPHPDPYLTALEKHDLQTNECIVIEDSERGLAAATAAGLRCYVIPNQWTKQGNFADAERVLENISQVPRLVEELLHKV